MSQYVKYLVCYDIQDNKSRTRFFNFLKDIGLVPIQKSVFYGDLKPAEAKSLAIMTKKMLNDTEDKCFWFPCQLDLNTLRNTCVGLKGFVYDEPDGHRFL